MSGTSEIRNKLIMWDRGQAEAEGLAALVLAQNGYEGIDPQHPLGGPDGGKDIICRANNSKWVGAAYFAAGEKGFTEIKKKFLHDLEGAVKNKVFGIAFVCNQKLTDSQRTELACEAKKVNLDADIYHLERLVVILNDPIMYGARLKFLEIEISKEEELAYLEAANKKQFEAIQKRLDDLLRIVNNQGGLEELWEFASRSEEEVQLAVEEFCDKVWFQRHLYLRYRIENGIETCDGKIWEGALASAQRVREKYGEENLGPYSDFEWGMLNGKLSALRWILGDEWDMLDT